MKFTTEKYRNEMKELFKNKWLCKVMIGAINGVLQNNGDIETEEELSECSAPISELLNNHSELLNIASFEKNTTDASGYKKFYNSQQYTGVIFNTLDLNSTITMTYTIREDYDNRDTERFIINFFNNYPKKIKITYNTVDSPFFKTTTYDNNSFTFKINEKWEKLTYIIIEMSDFYKNNIRLGIKDVLFGDIITFDNQNMMDTNSVSFRQYMSFLSEELPYKELSINVVNENQKYDIEDISNDVRLLEKGQKVTLAFGYEYTDGSVEYLEPDIFVLKNFEVTETNLNILCTDILNNMSDQVEVDTSSYVYDESCKTLAEGYEDSIIFDNRPKGFTPQGMHIIYEGGRKEGILMLANAYCEVVKIDSSNNINLVLNSFMMEKVTGDSSGISNIDSIIDYYNTDSVYFRNYATFEKDYTKANGSMIFPVEANNEFSGFIGNRISDVTGEFSAPIKLNVEYKDFMSEDITLIFTNGNCPKTYKYELYDRFGSKTYSSGELKNTNSNFLSIHLPIIGQYGIERITFYFLNMYKPFNTIHIQSMKDIYIEDYIIEAGQYENYYPSCISDTMVKNLILQGYKYSSTDGRSVLYEGVPVFDENNECIVTLNAPCLDIRTVGFNEEGSSPILTSHGVTLSVIPGKIKHVKLTNTGYDDSILKIYGTPASTSKRTETFTFNKSGDSIEITNDMLPNRLQEYDNVYRWYWQEINNDKLYKVNFMGDPAIENGDTIGIIRKQGDTVYIRVEKCETTFSGGGIRGYIEGRKI